MIEARRARWRVARGPGTETRLAVVGEAIGVDDAFATTEASAAIITAAIDVRLSVILDAVVATRGLTRERSAYWQGETETLARANAALTIRAAAARITGAARWALRTPAIDGRLRPVHDIIRALRRRSAGIGARHASGAVRCLDAGVRRTVDGARKAAAFRVAFTEKGPIANGDGSDTDVRHALLIGAMFGFRTCVRVQTLHAGTCGLVA